MSDLNTTPQQPRPQEIEREKDKMDLRPAITFVERNLDVFAKGREAIMQREPSPASRAWAQRLEFVEPEKINGPQVVPEEAREILMRMPPALIHLSKLQKVSYEYGNQIIEPVYNLDGTLKTGNTVEYSEFGQNNEHPTRVLVGMTPFSGDTIYQSALPKTVYERAEAAQLYQGHVLLHEFFHTTEIHMRDPEKRQNIQLETDGRKFTFQQWWERFEELILSGIEKPVSRYAAGYEHDLNATTKRINSEKFSHALAEQICESFVGYQQNILPNDENLRDFRANWPVTWQLMDILCRARVISNEDIKNLSSKPSDTPQQSEKFKYNDLVCLAPKDQRTKHYEGEEDPESPLNTGLIVVGIQRDPLRYRLARSWDTGEKGYFVEEEDLRFINKSEKPKDDKIDV